MRKASLVVRIALLSIVGLVSVGLIVANIWDGAHQNGGGKNPNDSISVMKSLPKQIQGMGADGCTVEAISTKVGMHFPKCSGAANYYITGMNDTLESIYLRFPRVTPDPRWRGSEAIFIDPLTNTPIDISPGPNDILPSGIEVAYP